MDLETDAYVHPTGGDTTLFLLRHGQTVANSLSKYAGTWDVALNDIGRRQAEVLAERLRDVTFDAAVSSHLSRAKDTAAAILGFHPGVPLEVDRDLAEWDFGDLEGKDFGCLTIEYPEFARQLQDPRTEIIAWPGGESNADFKRRIDRGLDRLLSKYRRNRVAIVTHGGVISTFMLHLTGKTGREDFFRYSPSNCSISEVRVTATATTIVRWNDVQHLESEGIYEDPYVTTRELARGGTDRGKTA